MSIQSLRRSGRIAARPRAANSTKQAQSMLLKKLGVDVSDAAIDSEIQQKLKETLRGQILFSGDLTRQPWGLKC